MDTEKIFIKIYNMEIKVRVKTRQPETKILKIKDNIYYIAIKSPPVENKANLELIKFLKKHFNKEVSIKSGFKSKEKIIALL